MSIASQYGGKVDIKPIEKDNKAVKLLRKSKKFTEVLIDNKKVIIPDIEYLEKLEGILSRMDNENHILTNNLHNIMRDKNNIEKRVNDLESYIRKGF